jgi:L,D-transpeptidase YcbB
VNATGTGLTLVLLFCATAVGALTIGGRSRPGPAAVPLADRSAVHDSVPAILRAMLQEHDGAGVAGVELRSAAEVRSFYAARGFEAAWLGSGGPAPAALAVAQRLEAVTGHGLDPEDYHAGSIASVTRRTATGARLAARELAAFELRVTDAWLTLGRHLARGRVDPVSQHGRWSLPRREAPTAVRLADALATERADAALASYAPRGPEYPALLRELRRLREVELGGGWDRVPPGPALRAGTSDPRVPLLRRRLGAPHSLQAADAARFNGELEAAVRAFQARHGLDADGVVGAATLEALNVSVARRARQVELALERERWLPADLGARHVRVDIPAFQLRLVEDGEAMLTMRVIGGRPDWQTPVFSARIGGVVLSPYWNVPTSIAVREILPEVRRDPGYLRRHDMQVLSGWGADARRIDPAAVDWRRVSATPFPYRFRQEPGPRNPLGGIRFDSPNPNNVFLHDTPARALFDRSDRALSHGCIRLQHPMALAEHVLRDEGWSRAEITAAIEARRERTVRIRTPIDLHLLYRTAWIGDDGEVHYRTDLYGHDRRLDAALSGGGARGEGRAAGTNDSGDCGV